MKYTKRVFLLATVGLMFIFIRSLQGADDAQMGVIDEFGQNIVSGIPETRYLLLANPNLTGDFKSSRTGRLADFDLDGDLDIVLHQGDGYEILANDGNGLLTSYGRLPVEEEHGSGIAAGDFDGDGPPDLLVSGMTTLLVNTGIALFNPGPPLPGMAMRYEVSDLDGDGDLDAFALYGSPVREWHIWRNQGGIQGGIEGVFVDDGPVFEGVYVYEIWAMGDVDDDGDPDVIIRANGHEAQLWLNQGGIQGGQVGEFADSGQRIGTMPVSGLALGDLDDDGDMDAFAVRRDSDSEAGGPPNEVWFNDAGLFSDSGLRLGGEDSEAVTLADVDLDGDLDAVVMNIDAGQVWLNSGGVQGGSTGMFEAGESFQARRGVSWTRGADMDGDGYPDIVGGTGYRAMMWLNRGSASLGEAGFFYGNLPTDSEGDYIFDWWELTNGVLPVALRQTLHVTAPMSVDISYPLISAGPRFGRDTLQFPPGRTMDWITAGEDLPGGEQDRIWNPYQETSLLLEESVEVTVKLNDSQFLAVDGPDTLTMVFHNPDSGQRRCFLEGMNFLINRLLLPESPGVAKPDGIGIPLPIELDIFRDVRDGVMAQTPQGQYYAGLYEKHSPELLQILSQDLNMLDEVGQGLRTWLPMLEALVAGEGHTVTITPVMVEQALDVLEDFEMRASPELARVIQQEREALNLPDFAGLSMDEALVRVNEREVGCMYLPAVYGE